MRFRIIALLSLCLVASTIAITAGPATAAAVPRGATTFDSFFASGDGTMLKAEVLLPEDGCDAVTNADGTTGCPTILSMGPYFGSGSQNGAASGFGDVLDDAVVSARFFDFFTYEFAQAEGPTQNVFEMGYAVVQVDSRGFGTSGGCNDYGGHGEQMDAEAAITWAGTQDWSNGNVGMWGKSYDGWTQVMGLAENPPHLEAVVIQAPIIDGFGIAYVNGVHHDTGWYLTTNLYALWDYNGGSVNENPVGQANNVMGVAGLGGTDGSTVSTSTPDPACWAGQNAEVLNPDRDWYFWQERDLRPRASRNDDVAVFWVHGFTDVNTKPDQVFGVYDGLNQVNSDKTRAWFGQWDHKRGTDVKGGAFGSGRPDEDYVVGRAGFAEEALDWMNHYLRGEDFVYNVNAENLVEVQDSLGEWRTEARYPAVDTNMVELPIAPGTYTDTQSSNGYWTMSEEATEDFRIAGESTVRIDVDITVPFANFVGVLYDVDGNRAEEISRSMYRIEESGVHTFQTHPGDWVLEEGHKLGFKIMSTHPESFPYPTGQTVTVNEGSSISIPVPTYRRDVNLTGVQTSARDNYTANVTGTIKDVDWGLADLAPLPYPDVATREDVQGPVAITAGSGTQ